MTNVKNGVQLNDTVSQAPKDKAARDDSSGRAGILPEIKANSSFDSHRLIRNAWARRRMRPVRNHSFKDAAPVSLHFPGIPASPRQRNDAPLAEDKRHLPTR